MDHNEYYTFNNYMNEKEMSATEEDYIEMIYRLCEKNSGHTRVNDIAQLLHVKPPSVTKMIKKLKELTIVDYKPYGCIQLTKKGIETGRVLVYRHNVIKRFLTLLAVKGDIHEETEKMEHTINKDTLKGIERLVDFFEHNPERLNEFLTYTGKSPKNQNINSKEKEM